MDEKKTPMNSFRWLLIDLLATCATFIAWVVETLIHKLWHR